MDEKSSGSLLLKEELVGTHCTICDEEGDYTVLYGETFSRADLNGYIFSARRLPDRIHCRIVKCKKCGLVRAHPYLAEELLEKLYQKSGFSYDEEVDNLKKTYGFFLKRLEDKGVQKDKLLEIGCGNGHFLEEALRMGYREVWGVEPSSEAREKAKSFLKERIIEKPFSPGLFPEKTFDVICLFQVLDHLTNPNMILKECYQLLKPFGFVICVNHNEKAFLSRFLGELSPIYDIQHPYLYNKETQKKIFAKNGFEVLQVESIANYYSISYWLHLMPLPLKIKKFLDAFIKKIGFSRLTLKLRIGNLSIIAKKVSDQ